MSDSPTTNRVDMPSVPPMNDGGKLGQLVRDTDWSLTPLGPYATWPQSLRSSLSLVLNSKGIAALYWGPEQWLLYNDAYSEALGDRHPWAFGRPMTEALSDIAPVLGPQIAEVQRTGKGFSIENLAMVMRRHGRNEETVWTYSFSPVQGEEGDFAGVLLLATEVTEQRATEQSQERTYADLLDSRQRLAALVQASSQVVYSHNADWSEMRQLTGGGFLADTTTANRHWFKQYIPKEEQPRVWEAIQQAIATKSLFDLEHQVYQADGGVGWTLSRAVPLLDADGEITEWFGAASDITPRKQAEEALRSLTDRLAQQVDTRTRERDRLWQISRDPFMISDLQGRWLSVNPAWTQLLGWSEEELVGRTSEWMEHPEDRTRTRSEVQHLAEGETTLRFVNRFRTKNDDYRWFSWTAIASDGLLYCVAHDITEQRELEESRQALEQQLRQSQKMEAVGQLTGGLAHDFNNLLAGISGALQLMQMRMQQGRFNDFERYIATAQGAAKRAAALTHRLLAFSRQQTLAPKPIHVNRLISDMHELIQRTVGPATPIEVVGASDAWTTLVDASQLENALLNLCINARDAMPDGGRITVETANKWMDERTAQQHDMPPGQYLALSVTDTGTGMPPEVMARAFDPFFTTKPIGQGTGLGLSMIYGFAQQSGGQVRIYSEVGQGTTVCIYLPRHYGNTRDESEDLQAPALKPSSQVATVLVVDDEPTVRMLLIEVLGDLGCAWIEAADSATGLKILQSDARIDLLVSDVGLPGGMNGRQMADAARAVRPDLKVLFITGYAENAILNHGHLAPGMAVLTKPFAIETIAERLRSLIEA